MLSLRFVIGSEDASFVWKHLKHDLRLLPSSIALQSFEENERNLKTGFHRRHNIGERLFLQEMNTQILVVVFARVVTCNKGFVFR